jgi:hypothetical protein
MREISAPLKTASIAKKTDFHSRMIVLSDGVLHGCTDESCPVPYPVSMVGESISRAHDISGSLEIVPPLAGMHYCHR